MTKRYQIKPIADEKCSGVTARLLAETDDYAEAFRLADKHSNWYYGSAVVDTETGEIDFGDGFR